MNSSLNQEITVPVLRSHDQDTLYSKTMQSQLERLTTQMASGNIREQSDDGDVGRNGESMKSDMRELAELFSKLNPMAAEFVPPSLASHHNGLSNGIGLFTEKMANIYNGSGQVNGIPGRQVRSDSSSLFSYIF